MLILPLPFETTTEAGRRICQRVQDAFNAAGQPLRYVWVASNANGYFGYTTTPEEYSRQNYEGGHTLYGQYSTPYLAEQLGILAQDFLQQGPLQELKPEWRYALKVNSFLPPESVSSGQRRWLQAPLAVAAEDTHEEDYIAVHWLNGGTHQIEFNKPLVRIEQRHGDQWQL